MKSLKLCTLGAVFAVLVTTVCHSAVKNAAFLQGSKLEDGSDFLLTATPIGIAWNERSSIDPSLFDHDVNSLHQLTVLDDGDYIVAATMPVISINTADNRPSQGLEIFVNGEPAPGSIGQSGYIRNQPRNNNMQQETSNHAHLLLQGLSAGDVIEVRAFKTAQPALATQIQTASLFVEKADDSKSLFSGLSSAALEGVNLNPDFWDGGEDPVELIWDSNRKDSGFTHSDGSKDIRLGAGAYLVYINVPMVRSTSSRLSPTLEILLDGDLVTGGQSRQGYMRNASGHIEGSVHFAGIVEVNGTQSLSARLLQSGNSGVATLPAGKQASILVEKLGDSGVFMSHASETTNPDNPEDWNSAEKQQVIWENPGVNDSGTYGHNGDRITVKSAGDYLLLYNDMMASEAQRPNVRITVEVNGEAYPGAESKSHYIRNASPHTSASATLAILLEDLSANDVVTVSAQQEGQNGFVGIEEFSTEVAILGLVKKESLDASAIQSAPRITSFSGGRDGFQVIIQEFSSTVDTGSVSASLNGESIEVSVTSEGGVATVNYTFDSVPPSQSSHGFRK